MNNLHKITFAITPWAFSSDVSFQIIYHKDVFWQWVQRHSIQKLQLKQCFRMNSLLLLQNKLAKVCTSTRILLSAEVLFHHVEG